MKIVGAFTYDGTTLTGPAAYMQEQGDAKVAAILAGQDIVFNYGLQSGASPDPITALLVALQTDYAGWKGSRDFFAAHYQPPAWAVDLDERDANARYGVGE